MTTELATRDTASIVEQVVIQGDLGKLSSEARVNYYREVCDSLGLNPLTKPFEYIVLNGKLTLYALKNCTDQLRAIHAVNVTKLERQRLDDLYIVTAYGESKGRQDSSMGVVNVKSLQGESLANALMKAETKAKRRLTLSLCGLGWTDESEVESIPSAQAIVVDHTTGEVQRPASAQPADPGAREVDDEDDDLWQQWVIKRDEALAMGMEVPLINVPLTVRELVQAARDLKQRRSLMQDRDAQPAAQQATGEEPSRPSPVVSGDIADALERNANLLKEARDSRIPGLGPLKADETWPIEKIEQANQELANRIRSRNGDLDAQAAREAGQGAF